MLTLTRGRRGRDVIVLRTYSGTRGGLKGAAGENARSNSQSRKRRRSCPSLSLGVRGPPPSTDADVWRKCIVFCKNAFRDPEPNSSSRRRSRGVLGRFGRLVGRPCPLYKAAYDGIDPGAAGTSGAYRELPSREEPAHIVARTWCFDRDSLRRPFPTYRPPPRALCAVIGAALETIVASLVAFGPA